ncbi:MAG: peptidoglycan -binding protein [Pseudomonadota bacterium]
MSVARSRYRERSVNYWPGFVDALATLLLAIMFLLSVFVLAQFLLSQEITGKDAVLNRLNSQIDELTALLALERSNQQELEDTVATLEASLISNESDRNRLEELLASGSNNTEETEAKIGALSTQIDEEKQISRRALSQVELLNQQISALRRQIAALEDALDASEDRDRESQTKIADLGKRLNVALAQRVQELNRYRSDFFGRLREILGGRADIRIVGDRFVFPSEVLFTSGGADLNISGKEQMLQVANALIEIGSEIPDDINWVLRVDGHTDDIPLSGSGEIKDNWELSSERSMSVVRYFITQGIPAERLVAAGFGEFQPIDNQGTDEARARNRRIELKLTER